MRTLDNISTTLTMAQIHYSYVMNTTELIRERGLDEPYFNPIFEASNILNALETDVLDNDGKSILCDVLVRKGYVTATDQLMFSENIYNDDDFDRV